MKNSLLAQLALTMTVLALAGCQSAPFGKDGMKPMNQWFKKAEKEEVMEPPVRMAVVWKDAFYEEPGKVPVRGMGGRVFFYDEDDQPVKVEGELVVYGYDDQQSQSNAADRKFVFPAERLQDRYTHSDMGHSYSIWVPWDEAGGVRKNISLIPVFKGTNGQLLKAGQTLCVLPGKAPEFSQMASDELRAKRTLSIPGWTDGEGVEARQTSFETTAQVAMADAQFVNQTSHVQTGRQIRTATIPLPRSLAERMQSLPQAEPGAAAPAAAEKSDSPNYAAQLAEKIRAKRAELEASKKESEGAKTSFSPNPFLRDTSGKFPSNPPAFGQPGQLH